MTRLQLLFPLLYKNEATSSKEDESTFRSTAFRLQSETNCRSQFQTSLFNRLLERGMTSLSFQRARNNRLVVHKHKRFDAQKE